MILDSASAASFSSNERLNSICGITIGRYGRAFRQRQSPLSDLRPKEPNLKTFPAVSNSLPKRLKNRLLDYHRYNKEKIKAIKSQLFAWLPTLRSSPSSKSG